MQNPTLIAFMGPNSQTGTAVREESARCNASIQVPDNRDDFATLATRVQQEEILLALPVWNSHEGEITNSRVIELLMEGKATLHKFWPKTIEFECISRVEKKRIRNIISVPVAKTQCSDFLKRIKAEFIDGGSTVQSYGRFVKDSNIDAVLCVPGTGETSFRTITRNAANDVNFTTFAIIGNKTTSKWKKEWGSLNKLCRPIVCSYAGVDLSLFSVSSTEDQTLFFNELTSFARSSEELPRIVFATRREPDRCGLIVESRLPRLPENILSEDGYASDIKIIPCIGGSPELYAQRVHAFLRQKFPKALRYPFVRHIGTKPCFFACPTLGILTHGYDITIVEPVVRRFIAKWFQMIDAGLKCTAAEKRFFTKYRQAFYKNSEHFFGFVTV
jgi:prephenate dehydratase